MSTGWAARACVSACLLVLALYQVPTVEVWAALAALPLSGFAGITALFLVVNGAAALKWWVLASRTLPLTKTVQAQFAGLAAPLVPSGHRCVECLRVAAVACDAQDLPTVKMADFEDRLIDGLALVIIAALSAVWLTYEGGNPDQFLARMISVILGILFVAFVVLPKTLPWIARVLRPAAMRDRLRETARALGGLSVRPERLALVLVSALSVQSAFAGVLAWIAASMGDGGLAAVWMFAFASASLAARLLPLTLSGLGLREVIFMAAAFQFGGDAAIAVAAGLVWHALLLSAGAIGAASWGLTTARPFPRNPCIPMDGHT